MDFKSARLKIWCFLGIIGLWLATFNCSQADTTAKNSHAVAPDVDLLIQVNVDRLVVDPTSQQPVVTLSDSDNKRAFPIWIGLSEARAIHSELMGLEHARPLTHDLLATIIDQVNGKIQRIVITHVKDNIFYATLIIKKDDALIEIDARPSDSLVMALKFNAPIYVARNLFEKMSVPMQTPQQGGGNYGLDIQPITPGLASYLSLESSRGVMISAVRPGSRAELDGIQPGDILAEIDGRIIDDLKTAQDLMANSKGPLKAKVIRGKQVLIITLHLE